MQGIVLYYENSYTLTCVEADGFLGHLIPKPFLNGRFKLSNHWGMDLVVLKSVEVKDL